MTMQNPLIAEFLTAHPEGKDWFREMEVEGRMQVMISHRGIEPFIQWAIRAKGVDRNKALGLLQHLNSVVKGSEK